MGNDISYNKGQFDDLIEKFRTSSNRLKTALEDGLEIYFKNIEAAWEDTDDKIAQRDADFKAITAKMRDIYSILESIIIDLNLVNDRFNTIKY